MERKTLKSKVMEWKTERSKFDEMSEVKVAKGQQIIDVILFLLFQIINKLQSSLDMYDHIPDD